MRTSYRWKKTGSCDRVTTIFGVCVYIYREKKCVVIMGIGNHIYMATRKREHQKNPSRDLYVYRKILVTLHLYYIYFFHIYNIYIL